LPKANILQTKALDIYYSFISSSNIVIYLVIKANTRTNLNV